MPKRTALRWFLTRADQADRCESCYRVRVNEIMRRGANTIRNTAVRVAPRGRQLNVTTSDATAEN
jgi:hypothetical protein